MKDMDKWHRWLAYTGAGVLLAIPGAVLLSRVVANRLHDSVIKRITTDLYGENLWEFVSALTRAGPQVVVETNLRAQEGKVIQRPLGPPKNFPSMEGLMFSFAQFNPMPTPLDTPVDTSVIIGKKAKRPFTISLPMMVSGMAFGIALSADAKWALARGSALAGTATCSGEGAYLPEENKAARIYIYMYHRGDWNKTDEILRNSQGIEMQFGQGAFGGVGHVFSASKMDKNLRKHFGYPPGKDAVIHSRMPEVQSVDDLPRQVERLRSVSGGVPIGAKIATGMHMEKDLQVLCNAGVDYIVLDGAEAATKGSSPVLQDDFGLPLVYAIPRAKNWLEKNRFADQITLIAAGKIRTPGEVLKAIALGADACYIGSIALFAMAHTQSLKSLPFEPPTQVIWYDGKQAGKFNKREAAQSLAKFLNACRLELAEAIRAAGKTSINQFSKSDLMALREDIAKGVGVRMAY